jgi:predicted nucleic acid-binding protein
VGDAASQEAPPLMPPIIVDTGVLYAIADRDDAWHKAVRAYVERNGDPLLVPITVLPEACYLLNTHLGDEAERALVLSLVHGEMRLEPLVPDDLRRASALLERYRDANIGLVDATVIAIAERLKLRRILTTDRRHFSMIRPRHCSAFELLP